MGEVLVGTCSWTDPTLIRSGRFYPAGAKSAEARLQFYASQFRLVEVDSSYYSMPGEAAAVLWAQRTGPDFVFDVKAFRLFTMHPTPLQVLPKDIRESLPSELKLKTNVYQRDLPLRVTEELWARFDQALLPLDSAGKLGIVLFQFPPWFLPGDEQRDYILSCKEKLPQYRIAVEFRQSTFAFLRENNLPYVCVDEPQGFKSSIPPIVQTTSDTAVVRFHGRNRSTWEKQGITTAERFNYLYSESELKEWVPRIKDLSERTRQCHVLFNNCHEDKAVSNARQIKLMLD